MATVATRSAATSGQWVPSTVVQFLPRCEVCGEKHPLANNPPVSSPTCLQCGALAPSPAAPVDVPAAATSRWLRFGNLLLRIGAFFHRIAEKLP